MELYQLRYFVEAAEEGNITRAAKRLSIAQPALSQQLRNLEEELGAQLMIRGRRGARLTAAGESFLPRARIVLEEAESAKTAVSNVTRLRAGRLAVASIPAMSGCWLPARLKSFRECHPAVEIRLLEGRSIEVAEMVEQGRADIGFLQFPVDGERFETGRLLEERFRIAVASNHKFAGRKTVRLGHLAGEPFVVYKGRARETALDACREAGFEPRVSCESGELETVRALVAAGLGVALLPAMALASPYEGVRIIDLKEPRLKRTLGWVRRRNRGDSAAVEAFMGFFDSRTQAA